MTKARSEEKRRWPLELAQTVAADLVGQLKSSCKRIQVAGSIRRRKARVGDVELLCIPDVLVQHDLLGDVADQVDLLDRKMLALIKAGFLDYRRTRVGRRLGYGPRNKFLVHVPSGMPVDVFNTTEEGWAMSLVVRTGPKEMNVRLMKAARNRGCRGHAYGDGFTLPDGSPVACQTEEEVFAAVGWPYLPPEERS